MTTEEFIIKTSDELLDVLLEHRKNNPDFIFWLRAKDFAGSKLERLQRGYWFQGSDYIYVAFYNKGDWRSKTKTFGFVVAARDPENPEVYISWIYTDPKKGFAPNEKEFYERLPEIFPNPVKIADRRYQYKLSSDNIADSLRSFLAQQKPKVDALLRELNLTKDFVFSKEKFEKRLARTLALRAQLKSGIIPPMPGIEDSKGDDRIRYWVIAPGDNARKWKEFYSKGMIGIGWEDLGDLSEFDSREEIRERLKEIYSDSESSQMHNSLALWEFFSVMKPGDILIPKRGRSEYLGYGIVTGEYDYDEDQDDYNHTRTVEWKKNGAWPEDVHLIVTKTLTDITKYPEYVDRLKRLIGIQQEAIIPGNINYWWLNANPSYWRITDYEIGQEQAYTTFNEKGNKRTIYKYFHEVKPGDLFLGYASSPIKKVIAVFEATKSVYINDDTGVEEIAFTIQKFLPDPVAIDAIVELPDFSDSEIKNNRQGSLYKLTKEQYLAVLNDDVRKEEEVPEFTTADALKELFIEEPEFNNILETLQYKKNIVLQGPPGTGKTFMAKLIAYAFMEEKDNAKIEMIQFHQSYSYEDFIQGYRPKDDGTFRLELGVFYRFCKQAQSDPNKNYFFIIDEINRGNLSKIFGELMLLLEHDKRGPEFAIPLTYTHRYGNKFYIPKNVYIIGTMNTADRSLSIVDYALRRRFAFIDVNPVFNSKFKKYLTSLGVEQSLVSKITIVIAQLNENIERKIGPGFQIGHSYFCNITGSVPDHKWYERIVKMEIEPLLREYWFDKIDEAKREVELLLRQ